MIGSYNLSDSACLDKGYNDILIFVDLLRINSHFSSTNIFSLSVLDVQFVGGSLLTLHVSVL